MIFFSCKKEEGKGGKYSIQGKVFVRDYDATFSVLNGEYYGPEVDVYIIYGNDVTFGDRVRTNYDGSYEFPFLRKGHYKVYAYSKDPTFTSPSGVVPKIIEVDLNGSKTVVLPDIVIIK